MRLFLQEKEAQQSVSSCESSAVDTLKPMDGEHDNPCCERPSAKDIHQDDVCSGVSTSNPVTNVSPGSCQRSFANPTAIIPPQSSELNKNSNEFKLNPGAKILSIFCYCHISSSSYSTDSRKCAVHTRQLTYGGCCWFSARCWDGHFCAPLLYTF
ncbi:uncharacterized protein LOC120205185 [Hibiscus syriacus]|uniref:uncharacterized protein LOC120205185 n=1 Tax=Hibiscus syriacus TaxID=106335 RepID=UPI0019238309|nr:uncharacterized protein LOC120205185 [Hibiscus syriacus]